MGTRGALGAFVMVATMLTGGISAAAAQEESKDDFFQPPVSDTKSAASDVPPSPGKPKSGIEYLPMRVQPDSDQLGAAGKLRLGDALAKVWTENPQVRQAELALRATEFDIKGARTGYFPYFQVQASQGESSDRSATTLIAVQPLWNGGLTAAQVEGARANQLIAVADLNRVRLELGQRLLEAFFNVAQADEQVLQWTNYVESLRLLLGSIERRAKQGVAPEADVQTALTRLKQAEAGIQSARALKLASQAQLTNLLNQEPSAVAWPSDKDRLDESEIASLASEPAVAHPERALVLAEIKLQEATARASRAALSPEVSLQHREQVEGVEFDPTNSATLLVMQFQSNNGLRGLRSYQAEKERIDAVRARLRSVDREISATIAVDQAQLRAAATQIIAQRAAAESSSALVDSFMRQFEVGRKSWLEVLNAQREANDTLLQAAALKRNFWYYNAKLSLDSMNWDRLSTLPPAKAAEKK